MEKELKQQFEEVCNAYLDAFVKRHDLVSADWVGPGVCEIVCANDEVFLDFGQLPTNKLVGFLADLRCSA